LGEKQAGAAGVWRSYKYPALAWSLDSVLNEVEAERLGEEVYGFVIVSDDEGDIT
jgi:hypothetical protein